MTDFLFRYRNIVPNLSFMFVNYTRKRHMKINYFTGLIKKRTKEHSPIFFSSFLLKEIYQKTPMAGRHGQTWRDCQRHTGQRTPWDGYRGLCCATTQEPAGFGMPGVLSGSVLQGAGRNTLQQGEALADSLSPAEYEERCHELLTQQMGICAQQFSLLPILQDTPEGKLLYNTIYSGVWSKYALVRKHREGRRQWQIHTAFWASPPVPMTIP